MHQCLIVLACATWLAGCGSTPPAEQPPGSGEQRGDGAHRLTSASGGASNQNPCVSPDGSFVVFTRFDAGYNQGPAHIYRLDLDGSGEPEALTEGDNDDVNVPFGCFDSKSGRVIFASDRQNANDLWSVSPDPAAADLRRETTHGELPVWIEPVYSPDGASVALEQDTEAATEETQRGRIVTVALATGEPVALTNVDGSLDDRLPSWSPAGDLILFQHRDPAAADSLEHWEAYVVDASGGTPENVSANVDRGAAGPDTDLSWYPDGDWVLSSANHDGIPQPSIFLLPVAGGTAVRVTFDLEHEDGAPCATPDGSAILFESHRTADEQSPSDLWIIDTPALP